MSGESTRDAGRALASSVQLFPQQAGSTSPAVTHRREIVAAILRIGRKIPKIQGIHPASCALVSLCGDVNEVSQRATHERGPLRPGLEVSCREEKRWRAREREVAQCVTAPLALRPWS